MSIGKIRNIGGNSGGGINLIENVSQWTSSLSSLYKITKNSDNSMRFGDASYTDSYTAGSIISEYFRLTPNKILNIVGTWYRFSNGAGSIIYLLDENDNETKLLVTNAERGAISITKTGLKGIYRIKLYFTHYGNWANYMTFTKCGVD